MNWFYPPHVGPWNQALPVRAAFSFFPYRASAGLKARLLLNKEKREHLHTGSPIPRD